MLNTLVVGAGPAGLAPFIAASRLGSLDRILGEGVAIVERSGTLGMGRIGRYAINSDSTGATLASCLVDNPHPAFAALARHPTAMAVAAYDGQSVPLTLVGDFMALLGDALGGALAASGNSVFLRHEALQTTRTRDNCWRTRLRRVDDGVEFLIESRFVVLATGGHQPRCHLETRPVGGRPLVPHSAAKLFQSDEALTADGLAAIGQRLAAGKSRRVAVVGSSSSAMACANALLHAPFGKDFGEGGVVLLHRRPLHIFYPSVAEALADGYDEFTAEDVCPISGFVFRLSGMRLEARELLMAARGIGGRPPEKRLRFYRYGSGSDPVVRSILDECDVVIAALGYRPRALPVMTASGRPVELFANDRGDRPLVDSECRVLDRSGRPIPGLLGIGLASGFFSREVVGGERSFSGQTNSLWQWQNAIGAIIAHHLQTPATVKLAEPRPAAVPRESPSLQSI